jgi:hypothetical protein
MPTSDQVASPQFRYILDHPSGCIEYPAPLSAEHSAEIVQKLSTVSTSKLLVYRLHRIIQDGPMA